MGASKMTEYVIDVIEENMACEKIRHHEIIMLLKNQIQHLKEETVYKNKQIKILLNFLIKNVNIGNSQIVDVVETIPVLH